MDFRYDNLGDLNIFSFHMPRWHKVWNVVVGVCACVPKECGQNTIKLINIEHQKDENDIDFHMKSINSAD